MNEHIRTDEFSAYKTSSDGVSTPSADDSEQAHSDEHKELTPSITDTIDAVVGLVENKIQQWKSLKEVASKEAKLAISSAIMSTALGVVAFLFVITSLILVNALAVYGLSHVVSLGISLTLVLLVNLALLVGLALKIRSLMKLVSMRTTRKLLSD